LIIVSTIHVRVVITRTFLFCWWVLLMPLLFIPQQGFPASVRHDSWRPGIRFGAERPLGGFTGELSVFFDAFSVERCGSVSRGEEEGRAGA
jgi:hypothetical protein